MFDVRVHAIILQTLEVKELLRSVLHAEDVGTEEGAAPMNLPLHKRYQLVWWHVRSIGVSSTLLMAAFALAWMYMSLMLAVMVYQARADGEANCPKRDLRETDALVQLLNGGILHTGDNDGVVCKSQKRDLL